MLNILIDTCSLIDLLTEDNNELLPHLEFWKDNKCINLITHEVILNEWAKHKEKQKKRFEDSLKTKYRHTIEITKRENISIPDNITPRLEIIENQINLIDKLLNDSLLLKTTDDVKALCSDRTISPRKAPFHNKLDSTKDAYIIFTALKYFDELGQNFVFISSNKNDFGAPESPATKLHPEILEDYKNIEVDYYSEIGEAINKFKSDLPLSLIPSIEDDNKIIGNSEEIIINRENPILDQIYNYIKIRFKELNVVPISILVNHYPFKNNIGFWPYYSTFSVSTDNQILFDLFSSIEIKSNGDFVFKDDSFLKEIKDYKSKTKFIFKSLSQNLIFSINSSNKKDQTNTRFFENDNCSCPKCNYRSLKFEEAFNSLNSYTSDIKDQLELGYIHYNLGNYKSSSLIFKSAFVNALKEKMLTTAFVLHFNLSKLYIFIRNSFINDFLDPKFYLELKNIDLDNTKHTCTTKENEKILDYINDSKFIINSGERIHNIVREIIDQYYNDKNGGWSTNSNSWKLINEFAFLEGFLNDNFIIYDRFTEFQGLSQTFIEGLFASHAIENPDSSKLEVFDDWLIHQLINYGKPDFINKMFYRYKLKKIKYKATSGNNTTFKDITNNLLTKNKNLKTSFSKISDEKNRVFWREYNKYFGNILILTSISDFDKDYLESFSIKLLDFLEEEDFLEYDNYQNVSILFRRIGNMLSSQILIKYFNLIISKSNYHKEDFFDDLLDLFSERKEKIEINKDQYELILNLAFEDCKVCEAKHSTSFAIPFYNLIVNENYKADIKNKIQDSLDSSFDFDLFYLSTIFDVIEIDEIQLEKAINISLPQDPKASIKSFFTRKKETRFSKMNHIANLYFKSGCKIKPDLLNKLMFIDIYYQWLFNMQEFNYKLFNSKWVGEYNTKYYHKEIFECKKIKKVLEHYLSNNIDDKIERTYLNIYVLKNWKKKK